MKRLEAENYVIRNARYQPDAPDNAKYFVRFPHPKGVKVFFSDDTYDLVNRVYNFGKTKEGRDLWSNIIRQLDILSEEKR